MNSRSTNPRPLHAEGIVIADYPVADAGSGLPSTANFHRLLQEWKAQRSSRSSIEDAVECPAYRAIIEMGPSATPLIFAQLRAEGDKPDQWFWALQALTNANPVAEQHEGNHGQMKDDWLTWAAAHGYAG